MKRGHFTFGRLRRPLTIASIVAATAVAVALAPPAVMAADAVEGAKTQRADPGGVRIAQASAKKKAESSAVAQQQGAPKAQEEPSAWAVNCSNQASGKLLCEMTQVILDQQSGRQILLISVKGAGGGANAMLFRVLHGVFLPAGLSIAVDGGKALTAQFQRSDQIGAYAVLPLDDKLVAELQKGKDLKVTVQLNQGENVAIAARLQGFGAALDKVMTIK